MVGHTNKHFNVVATAKIVFENLGYLKNWGNSHSKAKLEASFWISNSKWIFAWFFPIAAKLEHCHLSCVFFLAWETAKHERRRRHNLSVCCLGMFVEKYHHHHNLTCGLLVCLLGKADCPAVCPDTLKNENFEPTADLLLPVRFYIAMRSDPPRMSSLKSPNWED